MAKLDELVVELSADVRGLRSQLAAANKSIDGTADRSEAASRRMGKAFKAAGAAIAALGVARLAKGVVNTTAVFQQLEARLITATGTLEGAALAFSQLTEFTSKTPFQLQGVVSAFITLRQQGIQPTFEQFRAMGDAAAATGNDITRFSEAVVGALVGETERLKAFGIQSRIQGDQISFTFNGITKTVGRNAQEIVAALTEISQQNFAGGMERQMATLGGSFSNLMDAVSVLSSELGEVFSPIIIRVTGFLTNLAHSASEVIEKFRQMLDVNGALKATFVAVSESMMLGLTALAPFSETAAGARDRLREMRDNLLGIKDAAPQAAEALNEANKSMQGGVIGSTGGEEFKAEEDPAVTRQMKIDDLIKQMDEKEKQEALEREAEFQRKITQFKKAGASERVKIASTEIQSLIGSAASGSKTLFQIQKAAALAQAALAARESVVDAYKFGTKIGGPFLGSTFAGIAAAAQAANIAQIASSSFGGGGVPTVGTAPVNQFGQRTDVGGPAGQSQAQNVNLTITGSDKLTRAIAQSINTAIEDGVNLRVN